MSGLSVWEISRDYEFSAAHRIEGHPKCGRLHGHNYKVTVTIKGIRLDAAGMVLDYGDLDKVCKPLIDGMDHRYLVSHENLAADDPYARTALAQGDAYPLETQASTAECLAQMLVHLISLHATIHAVAVGVTVIVRETPKSIASYRE